MRPTVEALTPARDQLARGGHLLCDLLILQPVGGPQDNLGSQCEANGDVAARSVTVQLPSLGFGQCHSWCCSHVFLLLEETLRRDYKLHDF